MQPRLSRRSLQTLSPNSLRSFKTVDWRGNGSFLHLFGIDLNLDVEQVADRLLLDRLVHRLEEQEPLALVLHQRVTLGHGPQTDALLQVIHLIQVLTPFAVKDGAHDPTLHLAGDLFTQSKLSRVIGMVGVRSELHPQHLSGDAAVSTGSLLHLRDADRDGVEGLERSPEL